MCEEVVRIITGQALPGTWQYNNLPRLYAHGFCIVINVISVHL